MPRQGGEEMRKSQGMKKGQELGTCIYSHAHRKGREICDVSSMEVMRTARMLGVEDLELVVLLEQRRCSPQGPAWARNAFLNFATLIQLVVDDYDTPNVPL